MWRPTFVSDRGDLETSYPSEADGWNVLNSFRRTIRTHSDELNWARRRTLHELDSLSLVQHIKSFDVWSRPKNALQACFLYQPKDTRILILLRQNQSDFSVGFKRCSEGGNCDDNRELKQQRFWGTDVNRKWTFCIVEQWLGWNSRVNRL